MWLLDKMLYGATAKSFRLVWLISLVVYLILFSGCLVDQKKSIFLGDSIMMDWNLGVSFPGANCHNLGIGGYSIKQVELLLQESDNSSQVFVLVGTNNTRPMIKSGMSESMVVSNVLEQLLELVAELDKRGENYYIFSLNPVNKELETEFYITINSVHVEINTSLKSELSKRFFGTYIDSWSLLVDDAGLLSQQYTNDGLHLNDYAYKLLSNEIRSFIY